MAVTFVDLGTYGTDARPTKPAPLPAALLVVCAGQGFAVFDAAAADGTDPSDLAASEALWVHTDAAGLVKTIVDWRDLAKARREPAA